MITLLLLAACGTNPDTVGTNPGHNTDGPADTGDSTTTETEMAFLNAGQSATWNASTHEVENIVDLEGASYSLSGPDTVDPGFTAKQIDLKVGTWTTSYSYSLGDFTFTGDVTKDLNESTDFTASLDHIDGLDGLDASCEFHSDYDDYAFDTTFVMLEDGGFQAEDIIGGTNGLYANGPYLKAVSGNGNAILTEDGFYYNSSNDNDGDYYIECPF